MRHRHRVAVGLFIALCGLAIAAGSEFTWISANHGHPQVGTKHTSLTGLLHWSYQGTGSYLHSFAFAVVVAGALVFLGGLTGSRLVAGLFALIALAAGGLWLGLYATKYSITSLPYTDLRIGAELTIGGAVLALLATSVLHRRV